MPPFDQAGLSSQQLDAVSGAFRRDPWLALELSALEQSLSEQVGRRFWSAFADLVPTAARPAAAVLPALEAACRGAGGQEPPPWG